MEDRQTDGQVLLGGCENKDLTRVSRGRFLLGCSGTCSPSHELACVRHELVVP